MFTVSKYYERIHINIYLLGFLFYVCKAVFPPLKYLFAIFALISFAIFLKEDLLKIRIAKLKNFLIPFILILFYVIGMVISQGFYNLVLKEAFNILILLFYVLIFSLHFNALNYKFFRWGAFLLLCIGTIAIIRFIWIISGFTVPLSKFLFSSPTNKFSLVSDNNFYSLYFLLGIGIVFFLRSNNRISAILYLLTNTVFLVNIVLCFSRRGYFGLMLVMVVLPILLFRDEAKLKAALVSFYSLAGALLLFAIFAVYAFRFQIYQFDIKTSIISNNLYGLNSILNKEAGSLEFTRNLWQKVSDEFWSKYETDPDNLYYNGEFEYDLDFWSFIESPDDSVTHQIKAEGDYNYLEISRNKGAGFFQLVYHGRPIYFYKGITYKLRFDCRVVQGEGMPFKVGWWVFDNEKRPYDLPLKITDLPDGWKRCEVDYIFQEDHIKPRGFINSQQAGTIINLRNISLTTGDSLPGFTYIDQMKGNNPSITRGVQHNDLFGRRIGMWSYAIQLWKTDYSIGAKIFGNGFDYLPLYGDKFNNDSESYTYPHNPIISAFLYSGLAGGLFYIFFLLVVFRIYWEYRIELSSAFFMYLFVFIFSMFSGNSHFSIHVFSFLSIIPFIYKYFIEQERKVQISL